MENGNKKSGKGVLFVTGQPEVQEFLANLFSTYYSKWFYIAGWSSTREAAIRDAKEKLPGLIIFFETTHGIKTISETIYNLRLTGARVIFISSNERFAGDAVLETLVGYGVYDIILDDEIDVDRLHNFIFKPRDFKDVAIFYRMVTVPDTGAGTKQFELPNIEEIRQFSNFLDDDYLINPIIKASEGSRDRLTGKEDRVDERIFREGQIRKKKETKNIQFKKIKNQPSYNKPKNKFNDGDLEELF